MTDRMIVVDADHAMGVWQHMLVTRWRVHTRADALKRAESVLADLARQNPVVGVMHIVEEQAIPPDEKARAGVADLIRAGGKSLKGTSVVWEGEGFFRAAVVRGVVTGVTMLLNLPSPLRVFSSIDAAADWHLELTPGADAKTAKPALVAFGTRLRTELDARG